MSGGMGFLVFPALIGILMDIFGDIALFIMTFILCIFQCLLFYVSIK